MAYSIYTRLPVASCATSAVQMSERRSDRERKSGDASATRENLPDGANHAAGQSPVALAAQRKRLTERRNGGNPLPPQLQQRFESSLGADLSGVRVHTGEESSASADAVDAKAYTVGTDIHFNRGQYDPESAAGQQLLAHEVAHTAQQASSGASAPQYKLEVSAPGDAAELEADRAADAMVRGTPARLSKTAPAIHRVPNTPGNAQDASSGANPPRVGNTPQTDQLEERYKALDDNLRAVAMLGGMDQQVDVLAKNGMLDPSEAATMRADIIRGNAERKKLNDLQDSLDVYLRQHPDMKSGKLPTGGTRYEDAPSVPNRPEANQSQMAFYFKDVFSFLRYYERMTLLDPSAPEAAMYRTYYLGMQQNIESIITLAKKFDYVRKLDERLKYLRELYPAVKSMFTPLP
jgi:Domain of unknown function (DUF4157)